MLGSIIRARYEGGVFRPIHPVALREGEEVTVHLFQTNGMPDSAIQESGYSPAQAAAIKRIRNALTLDEVFSAANAAADQFPDCESYDPVEEMDRDRRNTGQRPLRPSPDAT